MFRWVAALVLLAPTTASAQCVDYTMTKAETGEEGRTTNCEVVDQGRDNQVPVFSCSGKWSASGAEGSVHVLRSDFYVDTNGKKQPLPNGAVISILEHESSTQLALVQAVTAQNELFVKLSGGSQTGVSPAMLELHYAADKTPNRVNWGDKVLVCSGGFVDLERISIAAGGQ